MLSSKYKYITSTIILNREKQEIFMSKSLQPDNFSLLNALNS